MTPPNKTISKRRVVKTWLTPDVMDALHAAADKHELSLSAVVEMCLRETLHVPVTPLKLGATK